MSKFLLKILFQLPSCSYFKSPIVFYSSLSYSVGFLIIISLFWCRIYTVMPSKLFIFLWFCFLNTKYLFLDFFVYIKWFIHFISIGCISLLKNNWKFCKPSYILLKIFRVVLCVIYSLPFSFLGIIYCLLSSFLLISSVVWMLVRKFPHLSCYYPNICT